MPNAKIELMKALNSCPDMVDKTIIIGETEFPVKIKQVLSPAEEAAFVKTVLERMKIDDEFCPVLFQYAFRSNLILFYTKMEQPKTHEGMAKLIRHSTLIDTIAEVVGWEQIDYLSSVCQDCIEYEQQKELIYLEEFSKSNPLEDISEAITRFLNTMEGKLGQVDLEALSAFLNQ